MQHVEMEMVASELVSCASQSVRQCLSSLPDSAEEEEDISGFVVKDEVVPERLKKPNSEVRSHFLNFSTRWPNQRLR